MAISVSTIESAIEAVLLNQSYEINGRKYVRADLKALQDLLEFAEQRELDNANGDKLPRGAYRASFN